MEGLGAFIEAIKGLEIKSPADLLQFLIGAIVMSPMIIAAWFANPPGKKK